VKIKLLMSAAIAALGAGQAWAQSAPETTDEAPTNVVVIIGQGETRQVQTLSAEDLQLEAAGTSAIKLIESLPGVNYTAADPFGNYEWAVNINIRGFQKDQLGYTLDRVPLGDMSYGNYNGLHISRAIISENIGKVELAQGAASLATASTSNLGGALAFTSRAPDDAFGGELALTAGSENMFRGYARLETGAIDAIGGGKAAISYANHTQDKWKGDGEQKSEQINVSFEQPIGPGVLSGYYNWSKRREQDYQDLSLAMIDRLGHEWDNFAPDWDLAQLVADIANNRGDTGAPVTNVGAGTVYPAPIATVDDAYYDAAGLRDDELARLSYDIDFTDNLSGSVTGYLHTNEGQGIWFTPYVSPFSFGATDATLSPISVRTTEYDMDRKGVLGSLTWMLGDHTIEGGFWVEENSFDQARRFYANTRAAPRPTLEFMRNAFATQWEYAYDFTTQMFHVQDTWDVTTDISVSAGFKSVSVEMTVDTLINGFAPPTPGANNDLNGEITSEDNFLPQLGFTWAVGDGEVFGGYTENMRAHTLAPAASQTQSGFDFIKANTDPESSKTTEVGYRYRNGPFQGVAALYYVKFDDRQIGLSSGAGIIGSPSVIKNVGSVTTQGLELAGSYDITDEWTVFGSYAYNDSTYDADVVDATLPAPIPTGGKTVVNAPEHLLKADLGYDNGSLYGKLSVAYTGKRFFSYDNLAEVDAYTLVDLTAGYRLGGKDMLGGDMLDGAEIQLNVTNLLDEDYVSTIGTNGFGTGADGQTLMVGSPRQVFATIRKSF
jgi:iron complex outermembrane receptor protein